MFELYLQYEYWFAALQLLLAMLGMGATLRFSDFRDVFIQPKAVSLGLFIQTFAVPFLGYVFISLISLPIGLAVGVVLIAAIPGGTVSNIFTHFAKGNTALSIAITTVTTLACLISTPIILKLLISEFLPSDFSMPVERIAMDIGLYLLLPLLVGMLILHFQPKLADRVAVIGVRGSLGVIVLIVVGSLGSGRLDLAAFGFGNLLVTCSFAIGITLFAWLLSVLFKVDKASATAIEMEVAVRSINLALLINASLFPAHSSQGELGNVVLFTLLVYGGFQLMLGGGLIAWRSRVNGGRLVGAT